MERRTISGKVETRDGDKGKKIEGYGSVFFDRSNKGTEFQLWSGAVERFMPGCFDRALKEGDVRSCFNHDPNIVLGRTSSGTLALSLDGTGLKYSVDAPDTQLVRDQVLSPLSRGDVNGSSIMFSAVKVAWGEERDADGRMIEVREILDADLYEVGPVTFPAYEATTSQTRSADDLEKLKEERTRLKSEQRSNQEGGDQDGDADQFALEMDLRLMELQAAE